MPKLLGCVLAALLAGSIGCGEAEPEQARSSGSICPKCTAPMTGGETTDFSNSGDLCYARAGETEVAEDDPRAIAAGIERLVPLFERYRVPFRWSRRTAAPSVSGYEVTTEAELGVRLQRILYSQRSVFDDDGVSVGCVDWLLFDLELELRTTDGAFAMRAPARAWQYSPFGQPRTDDVVVVVPVRDHRGPSLSEVTGTLRYTLDGAMPDEGSVDFELYLRSDGPRGHIEPSMYFPSSDEGYVPLVGDWPADGCDLRDVPVAADEAHAAGGEQTPNQLLMQLANVLEAPMGWDARWFTGAATQLSLELGSPQGACYRPGDNDLGVRTTLAMTTADSRLRRDFSVNFYFEDFESADGLRYVEFWTEPEPLDASSFEQTGGIAGVPLEDTDTQVGVWSRFVIADFGGENALDGIVEVLGYDGVDQTTREALMWCTGSGCPGQLPRDVAYDWAAQGGTAGRPGGF